MNRNEDSRAFLPESVKHYLDRNLPNVIHLLRDIEHRTNSRPPYNVVYFLRQRRPLAASLNDLFADAMADYIECTLRNNGFAHVDVYSLHGTRKFLIRWSR
jgi:hypothetical protein